MNEYIRKTDLGKKDEGTSAPVVKLFDAMGEDDLVRPILGLQVGGRQRRNRLKLTWEQKVRTDMAWYGIDGILGSC